MKYAVNEEGVQALKGVTQKLEESVILISNAASSLGSVAEEHLNALGPHHETIVQVLEDIRKTAEAAAEPIENISELLNDVAEAYQEVIDNDRFNSSSLGTSVAGAAAGVAVGATVAAAAAGTEKNSLFGALGKMFSDGKESDRGEKDTISAEAAELQRMGVNRVELSECDEINRKAVLSAVKSMFAAHPELRGQLSEVICKPMRGGTYAAYGPTAYGTPFGGSLKLNSSYFSDPKLADDLAEKSRLGWFVPNATPASVVMHELGHGLHLEMCALDCGVKNGSIPSREDYEKIVDQYMDDIHADDIVEQACGELGIEFESWEFSERLSKYGGSNYGEAIAEAVAEAKNSPSPRPLAQAIYNGVTQRLNGLRRRL